MSGHDYREVQGTWSPMTTNQRELRQKEEDLQEAKERIVILESEIEKLKDHIKRLMQNVLESKMGKTS